MPKKYRCNKINEKGEICNDTNEDNFSEGRYTTCIKCRLKIMSEYNKAKKEEKQGKTPVKSESDKHTIELIKDTIQLVPLIDKMAVPVKIHDLEVNISNICTDFGKKFQDFETKMSLLEDENIKLKLQLLSFKEYMQKILNEKL